MKTSAYLLAFVLLLLPVAAWIEHVHSGFWQQRLFIRSFGYEPGRQEVIHKTGTILPTYIEKDLTITPNDNPVLLQDTVTIAPGSRLTIEADTKIYTHEFSGMIIHGELIIKGAENNRVDIYSNHKHLSRNIWSGFVFKESSQGEIRHAVIRHGSPAVSCLKNSRVTIEHTRLHMGEAGLFTESETCTLKNSVIHGVRNGVITTRPNHDFSDNRISGSRNDILIGN